MCVRIVICLVQHRSHFSVSAEKPYACFGTEANCRFRHRSLLFLYSRPCRTFFIDLFLLAKTLSSHFSVQKHQFQKNASMKYNIFPEILIFEGRECIQIKLLCRNVCICPSKSSKICHSEPLPWTRFSQKYRSVPKPEFQS